ncbi:hypothetical protein CLV33_101501 [Jejuia pallidilutea]|uniref:DUF1853 family protein n=1 Tax=Jejuia pallidilutea TaxID=504487 RepID=A0A362X3U7_9FLAO|nr:DUF1853 family protein [Jejuia pallidilutea]PQV51575.1 hypothetical protein CLV33_101501 [Jejuia pallidilutea]
MKNILQKRYEGFLNTPCLWHNTSSVLNLKQFTIASKPHTIDILFEPNLRLGKYVERLVAFELSLHNNISVLAENIQIQKDKTTLGELDCLLLKNKQPIHLEIIYKFYLYDDSVGTSEIEHFIGPNRRDALTDKLTKLKEKQLPLLYANASKPYLERLNLNCKTIEQQVYFKAQLFVPFSKQNIELKTLNSNCIVGFYINLNNLHKFTNCKFYIPCKKDWLLQPHTNVNWLDFYTFKKIARDDLEQKFSTLCWIKYNNGELKKVFLVWW